LTSPKPVRGQIKNSRYQEAKSKKKKFLGAKGKQPISRHEPQGREVRQTVSPQIDKAKRIGRPGGDRRGAK